jgi:hypothetical protein
MEVRRSACGAGGEESSPLKEKVPVSDYGLHKGQDVEWLKMEEGREEYKFWPSRYGK